MPISTLSTTLRDWRLPAVAALALVVTAPSHAGVFEIKADGAIAPVMGVDTMPPATLEVSKDATPLAEKITTDLMLRSLSVPSRYATVTANAAIANGLAPALLAAVVWQESRWRSQVVSAAGAVGLGQIMPSTASSLRVDPRDPVANLYGAAHYLRQQMDRFGGNVELALAAYNAGPTRVIKAGGVPAIAETRGYVTAIMSRLSVNLNTGN